MDFQKCRALKLECMIQTVVARKSLAQVHASPVAGSRTSRRLSSPDLRSLPDLLSGTQPV